MKNVVIGMEVSKDAADGLLDKIEEKAPGINIERYEKANTDGTVESVMVVVQTLSSVISAISPIILYYLQKESLRKIKVDNDMVENPTSDKVEALLSDKAE